MVRVLIIPVVAAVVLLVELGLSYRGVYTPPSSAALTLRPISVPSYVVPAGAPERVAPRRGVVLVDSAHRNQYDPEEIRVLLERIAARGGVIDFLGGHDPRDFFGAPSGRQREELLREKLRGADALLVPVPDSPFTAAEIEAVQSFVGKGGRLLLVGDPGRSHALNSVASSFGITFAVDYLYNVVEHEGNFRNVFFSKFLPDPLTRGLQRVVLYTAGSLAAPLGVSLVTTDASTYSSEQERWQLLSSMVKDTTGLVVAVNDLTFLSEPYNSVADNDRLITNLAEFLNGGSRRFDISDFPDLFRRDMDLLVTDPRLLEQAAQLKMFLEKPQRRVRLAQAEDFSRDTVILGTFADSEHVAHYLSAANILVGTQVRTPFAPALDRNTTALLLLARQPGRSVVVALADGSKGLQQVLEQLKDGTFRKRLVSDHLGIYSVSGPGPGQNTKGLKLEGEE